MKKITLKNKQYQTGLICGRFYPYHLGHKKVIEAALQESNQVHIIVCQRKQQSINALDRIKWIKESFVSHSRKKDIFYHLLDQDELGMPDRGAQIWATAARQIIGCYPDAVFTSEKYQKEYADCLKAELFIVDEKRQEHTVSATKIRNKEFGYRDFLEEHVASAIENKNLVHDQ